ARSPLSPGADRTMSDDLLLTLLWLLPLVGAVVVLFLPSRAETTIKGVSLGVTLVTFALTLAAYGVYAAKGSRAAGPLAERAEANTLVSATTGEVAEAGEEAGGGESDLMVRRTWIPYFNIEYFLGLDGISLSLVILTGLVSVLACLASWNIEHQVKGYF